MVHRFASILNCVIMNIPFTYLGMIIRGNQKKKNIFWKGIINKIKNRLVK